MVTPFHGGIFNSVGDRPPLQWEVEVADLFRTPTPFQDGGEVADLFCTPFQE